MHVPFYILYELKINFIFFFIFFHYRITLEVTLNGRKQNVQMPPDLNDMINDPKCGKVLKI